MEKVQSVLFSFFFCTLTSVEELHQYLDSPPLLTSICFFDLSTYSGVSAWAICVLSGLCTHWGRARGWNAGRRPPNAPAGSYGTNAPTWPPPPRNSRSTPAACETNDTNRAFLFVVVVIFALEVCLCSKQEVRNDDVCASFKIKASQESWSDHRHYLVPGYQTFIHSLAHVCMTISTWHSSGIKEGMLP